MELTSAHLAMVLVAAFTGAVLQRLSGTGIGLVVAPTLSMLIGAGPGVLLTNSTTMVSGGVLTLTLFRRVNWRRTGLICLLAAPGAVVGALTVGAMSAAWLQVLVGAVVLGAVAMTAMASALGRLPEFRAPWITPLAGFVGGFLNTSAGVSAPAMVIHSRLVRWSQTEFAASMQPVFMTMGALSVASKLVFSDIPFPVPSVWFGFGLIGTVVLGVLVGTGLARWVEPRQASRVAMVLAGLGGLGTLLRGVLGLV